MTNIVTNADGSITVSLAPRIDHVEIYELPSIPFLILLATLVIVGAVLFNKNRNRNLN
jgi:hypothetical protein